MAAVWNSVKLQRGQAWYLNLSVDLVADTNMIKVVLIIMWVAEKLNSFREYFHLIICLCICEFLIALLYGVHIYEQTSFFLTFFLGSKIKKCMWQLPTIHSFPLIFEVFHPCLAILNCERHCRESFLSILSCFF